MEPKLLGFVDAMKVANIITENSLDWLFLDETISPKEVMYLIQESLGEDEFGIFLFLLLGDQLFTTWEEAVEASIATLQLLKVRNLLTFYQTQREQ